MAHPAEDIVDFEMDEDSDEEMEPAPANRRGGGGPGGGRLPLHQFLRLIAGGRLVDPGGAAASNAQLLANLRRGGVVMSDHVTRALTMCPRDAFVPEAYREEAFIDAPIRVEEHGFNISAPHMHATVLEALDLQPGQDYLDVGSGCGILTAAGALMVGPGGKAVGIDVRRACVQMGRAAVASIAAANQEFAAAAGRARFEVANAFMPPASLVGAFDRVHVGASCPPDRVQFLLQLLKPDGGLIVVPVAPNDLRVITRRPDGQVTQRVVSQVRFSELEVPTDAEMLLAMLRTERRGRTAPPRLPSTFAQDVAAIHADLPPTPRLPAGVGTACADFAPSAAFGAAYAMSGPFGRLSSLTPCFRPGSSPSGVLDGLPATPPAAAEGAKGGGWQGRLSRLISSCASGPSSASLEASSSSGNSCAGSSCTRGTGCDDGGGVVGEDSPGGSGAMAPGLDMAALGDPDCVLVHAGEGWEVPCHWAVLRRRCDHFRAFAGGCWADAGKSRCAVPDQFSRPAVESLIQYVYTDEVDPSMDPQALVGLLHAGLFYGCSRLAGICETRLARLLKGSCTTENEESLADAAAALLALADDHGLTHLRSVALDFIVHNMPAVKATEAWAALSWSQVEAVAVEAAAAYASVISAVRRLHDTAAVQLPEPGW